MAATQYQIFCKYLNESTNKIVSNSSEKEWISAQTWYQSKVAYNVTDREAQNAMTLAVDSMNTDVRQGATYRELYDAIKAKMATVDPVTHTRLKYSALSVEEKKAYDLCQKYLDILDMVADNKCVIEYAMIRPYDELQVVPPLKTSVSGGTGNTTSYTTDFHHGGHTAMTTSSMSSAGTKIYKPTQQKELLAAAKLLDNDLAKIVYGQLDSANNDKYNMLFTFAGMVQTTEQLDGWICDGSLCTTRYYRHFPEDVVLAYQSQSWHTSVTPQKPGVEYTLGSEPVKCFNGPSAAPSISGTNATVSVCDVTFPDTDKEVCSAVYEGMERLKAQPWFLVATCNSLRAAMTKVEQLIDIYGKDAVKLGKVVPLDQYIEIV